MDDDRVIQIIGDLGLEIPELDEKYNDQLYVRTGGEDQPGVILTFKEIKGYTKNGMPCLTQIDFYPTTKVTVPFGLTFSDNYDSCCKKLGDKAKFKHKLVQKLKIWTMKSVEEMPFNVSINFETDELFGIKTIVNIQHDAKKIGNIYIEN